MKYKPDFEKAYITANNILISSSEFGDFPVRTKKLIEGNSNIKCCSYKKAKKYNGLNIEDLGSKSAVLTSIEDKHIIFYNESDLKARVRFSMLHEYGHYKLEHNLDVTDEELYQKYEIETNYFTAQLLMPEQVLREIQNRGKKITKDLLIELFGVSNEAAEKRINTLNKNLRLTLEEKLFDDIIVSKYKEWLDRNIPQNNNISMFLDEYEMQKERETWMY